MNVREINVRKFVETANSWSSDRKAALELMREEADQMERWFAEREAHRSPRQSIRARREAQ